MDPNIPNNNIQKNVEQESPPSVSPLAEFALDSIANQSFSELSIEQPLDTLLLRKLDALGVTESLEIPDIDTRYIPDGLPHTFIDNYPVISMKLGFVTEALLSKLPSSFHAYLQKRLEGEDQVDVQHLIEFQKLEIEPASDLQLLHSITEKTKLQHQMLIGLSMLFNREMAYGVYKDMDGNYWETAGPFVGDENSVIPIMDNVLEEKGLTPVYFVHTHQHLSHFDEESDIFQLVDGFSVNSINFNEEYDIATEGSSDWASFLNNLSSEKHFEAVLSPNGYLTIVGLQLPESLNTVAETLLSEYGIGSELKFLEEPGVFTEIVIKHLLSELEDIIVDKSDLDTVEQVATDMDQIISRLFGFDLLKMKYLSID